MSTNMFSLDRKVAIITGGNGGIGLGIAVGLGNAGAKVVIAARDKPKIEYALAKLKDHNIESLGIETDVTDDESISNLVNKTLEVFGRLDILVNNAGVSKRKFPQEITSDEWSHILNVNLTGVFKCSKEVYIPMVKAGSGKIINIGSMTSIFGQDYTAPYAATKGGVVQLTKSLANAWARNNIQVNSILPGWVETDLTLDLRSSKEFKERYELISARIPSGRWGQPSDLAGTAVFLASHASNYITGASIPVDGGYTSF